jgi:hypothetical protein
MATENKEKLEKIRIEISQCKTKGDFKRKNKTGYIYLAKRKLLKEFLGHLPEDPRKYKSLGGKENPNYKYSDQELIEEGNKHKTKTDFQKNSPKMHKAAYRRGLLKFCNFPENASIGRPCPWKIWDRDTIPAEANKYKMRRSFQKGSSGAYDAAINLGILDEVCKHMVSGYTISEPETELSGIIIKLFPKSYKKKFSVKISSKPWIKRFELDILNPSNMKAIEYDGEYHHSEKHLIKNKTQRGWPTEDAANYHPIKDSYFLNYHKIEILHIKGEDWKRDKQSCIQLAIAWLSDNCSIYPKSPIPMDI